MKGEPHIMSLMEAQESLFARADYCKSKWASYLGAIVEARKEEGRLVDPMTLNTTALMLENLAGYIERMDETSRTTNIGGFIHYGFELIAAVMPSLISNEVFSVQPMTRRIGEIFYLSFLYGTTKGNINADEVMLGAKAAGNAGVDYTLDSNEDEIVATGNGSTANYVFTVTTFPVTPGSVTIHAIRTGTTTVMTMEDDGEGGFTGDVADTSPPASIDYATGEVDVTFPYNVKNAESVFADYSFSFEANPELIPEVNINIANEVVTAKNRKLRALYSLDSMYDVQQAFGKDMDVELKTAIASEIRQEIDGYNLNKCLGAVGSANWPWNDTPGTGVAYEDHKWSFIDTALIPASNAIFTNTRRGVGNFVVAGMNVCNIIESLAPRFKREGKAMPGPHYIGTLDGNWKVYKNPFYNVDKALVGYKGEMFLEAGFVYAPYLPLYTTRTIMLDDMIARLGLASSGATKMVNEYFFSSISIT